MKSETPFQETQMKERSSKARFSWRSFFLSEDFDESDYRRKRRAYRVPLCWFQTQTGNGSDYRDPANC
jgi:hypothetical protein